MNKIATLFGLLTILLLAGCSTPSLSFIEDPGTAPGQKMPLYILGASLQNTFKPCCQPRLTRLLITEKETGESVRNVIRLKIIPTTPPGQITPGGNTAASRPLSLQIQTEHITPSPDGLTYLILLETEQPAASPVTYIIEQLTGVSDTRFIQGQFQAILYADIPPHPNGVFYLGHLSLTLREREGNELRAGPLLPEVDQFLTGFSTGTFDIAIEDRYDQDIAALDIHQPISRRIPIKKALLPPFNADAIRQWWEMQQPYITYP